MQLTQNKRPGSLLIAEIRDFSKREAHFRTAVRLESFAEGRTPWIWLSSRLGFGFACSSLGTCHSSLPPLRYNYWLKSALRNPKEAFE